MRRYARLRKTNHFEKLFSLQSSLLSTPRYSGRRVFATDASADAHALITTTKLSNVILQRPRLSVRWWLVHTLCLASFFFSIFTLPRPYPSLLQETGSYAEFSRLLQYTADGNIFKKVNPSRYCDDVGVCFANLLIRSSLIVLELAE